MKKYLLKTACFSSIFFIAFATVAIIDPFQRFELFDIPSKDISSNVALSINSPLAKIIEYEKNPEENIILGDSRMANIDVNYIKFLTDVKYFNFAFTGATLDEMCDAFWIAAKIGKLKRAVLGIDLFHFNASNSRNRIPGARKTASQPFLYLSNRDVIKATYVTLRSIFVNNKQKTNKQQTNSFLDWEQFWAYSLNVIVPRYYLNYKYDELKSAKLRTIYTYCRKNGIELVFIVPFNHLDVQKIMDANVSEETQKQFYSQLSSFGDVYNFNYNNAICMDKDNFGDPLHVKGDFYRLIIDEVWGNKNHVAKIIRNTINSTSN